MSEGVAKLLSVNAATAVAVKVLEDTLPVLDVFPQASKLFIRRDEKRKTQARTLTNLVEANGAAPVRVLSRALEYSEVRIVGWSVATYEDRHEQFDGVKIER